MASVSLAPFRHRDFALFWTGAFLSNIGTWMEAVALGYYVAEVTHQAAWNGVIAAAAFLPTGLVGPIGGAMADRRSRKALLLTATLVQAALAALIAALVAVDAASPPVITLIVLASGTASAVAFPAFQAILPELVPPEELVAGVALGSAQFNLGRILGPALAGVVIAVSGIAAALAVNAASFLAVVLVLLLITLAPAASSRAPTTVRADIVEAVRFVRGEPGLRVAMALFCLVTFLAAPFIALVPAMAVTVLGGTEATTSVLVTAQGVGAVAAALALGHLSVRFGLRRVLLTAVAGLPVALVAYAVAPSLLPMAGALVVVGALYLTELASITTIAQQRAPDALRGRILSLFFVVLGLVYPAGALLQGRLADWIGLRATTAAGAVLLGLAVVGVRLARPGITAPLDRPVAHTLGAMVVAEQGA